MTTDIEDMLGLDNDPRPKAIRRPKTRHSRGPLHDVLTKALPDLVDAATGVCNLHKLAKALTLSPQGVYKWMRPKREHRLPKNQVDRIVLMSTKQKTGGAAFVPATVEEFWPYISS